MGKWTPEPWHACQAQCGRCVCNGVMDKGGTSIATFFATDSHSVYGVTEQCAGFEEGHANRHRAVACVNALAGLNPEAVGEVVRILSVLSVCDMNDNNCASLEIASQRVRNMARDALAKLREVTP